MKNYFSIGGEGRLILISVNLKTKIIMEEVIIEKTNLSPYVNFNPSNGVLEITGRSIPEDSIYFYNKLFDQIDLYRSSPQKKTTIRLFFEYINSASMKCIFQLLGKFDAMHKENLTSVELTWKYDAEDDDLEETGIQFEEVFSFKVVKEPVD